MCVWTCVEAGRIKTEKVLSILLFRKTKILYNMINLNPNSIVQKAFESSQTIFFISLSGLTFLKRKASLTFFERLKFITT